MGKRNAAFIVWLFLFGCGLHVAMTTESEAGEEANKEGEFPEESVGREREDKEEEVEGRIIVGVEEGWREGRVEEMQLTRSAKEFNFNVQISRDGALSCEDGNDENGQDYILLYLPRPEGLVQAPAYSIMKALKSSGAEILLPEGSIKALVGWGHAIRQAARTEGHTDLADLASQLRSDPKARVKHAARFDTQGQIFHVLDDLSHVGHQGLEVTEVKSRYELRVGDHAPSVILATPTSPRGRSLLLAVSDYLVGTHVPGTGCVECLTSDDPEIQLNVSHVSLVGIFVTRPQPFLEDSLGSILENGLIPGNTKFLVYNTIEEYGPTINKFVQKLREDKLYKNVTVLQSVGGGLGVGVVKNMMLEECKRIKCRWFLHIDAAIFLNPMIPGLQLSLGHPVLAPALSEQGRIPASFWREVDGPDDAPTYSWDHKSILDGKGGSRGYWHATCLRGIYALRHDIIDLLKSPYTHTPQNPDLAFCSALRDSGVPMVVQTAFQEQGALLNTSGHGVHSRDVNTFVSNPLLWNLFYVNQDFNTLMGGQFQIVERPCYEVYVYPAFTPRFTNELIQIANSVNQWSTATTKDMRKEYGLEEVPTVDQWFSQLGLEDLLSQLFSSIFQNLQLISYPSSYPEEIPLALVARFKADEVPGLPQHNDASVASLVINLTPSDLYEGGEIEFPVQGCRVKPEAGYVLVYPGRLTHPKIFHNVTKGVLHRAIIHIDNTDKNL